MESAHAPPVDSHVHVVGADESRFPRQPTGAGSDWWTEPNGVGELLERMDRCGVDRAVVVQAVGVYGHDNRYAASVTRGTDRLAFVAAPDLADADPEEEIRGLATSTELVGARLFGVGAHGSSWLGDGTAARVWALAAELDLVLVPTVFPDALPSLRELVEERPEVEVALDHCAFPDLGGPGAFGDLLALADLRSVHLKVTSHNLHTDRDPAGFVEPLAEAFGMERLCWGSDLPQHRGLDYPGMLELARHACRNLRPHERERFMGANTLRLFWPASPAGDTDRPGGTDAG